MEEKMSEEKKSKLVPSVESGLGLKSLAGLCARVSHTETYNIFVDCDSQYQSRYLYEKYTERYCNPLFKVHTFLLDRKVNNVKVGETGLFMTTKEISMHALLKNFVEEEHMVVQSGEERFANKYNTDVAERIEAAMPGEKVPERQQTII